MDKGICCIVIALFDAAKEKKKGKKKIEINWMSIIIVNQKILFDYKKLGYDPNTGGILWFNNKKLWSSMKNIVSFLWNQFLNRNHKCVFVCLQNTELLILTAQGSGSAKRWFKRELRAP